MDLAIFAQLTWLLGQGEPGWSSILGVHMLGDHFTPVLYALAPLAKWFDIAPFLLVTQSVVVALSGLFLFALSRRVLSHTFTIPLLLLAAYYSYGPLHFATLYDFHPSVLALLPLSALLYAMWCSQDGLAAGSSLAAMLCDERCGPIVVMAGVCALLGRQRRQAALLIPLGTLGSVLMVLTVAHFSGTGYRHFARLTRGFTESVGTGPPVDTGALLYWLYQLLLPMGLLPLLRARQLLPALPVFAAGMVGLPAMRTIGYHYHAPAIPFLFGAALAVLRNGEGALETARGVTPSRQSRNQVHLQATVRLTESSQADKTLAVNGTASPPMRRLGVAVWLVGAIVGQLTDSSSWRYIQEQIRPDQGATPLKALADRLPPTASLACQQRLLAHVAGRRDLSLFPNPFLAVHCGKALNRNIVSIRSPDSLRARLDSGPGPQFVILDDRDTFLPLASRADYVTARHELLRSSAYQLVERQGPLWVFHRGPESVAHGSPAGSGRGGDAGPPVASGEESVW